MKSKFLVLAASLTLLFASSSVEASSEHETSAETLSFIGAEVDQTIAAYVSNGLTTWETWPTAYYTVAITPTKSGGIVPNYPFGATVTLEKSVEILGVGNKKTFLIEDINPRSPGESAKALDIFFGKDTTTNTNLANRFGIKEHINYIVDM